jgi:hypothetical protein
MTSQLNRQCNNTNLQSSWCSCNCQLQPALAPPQPFLCRLRQPPSSSWNYHVMWQPICPNAYRLQRQSSDTSMVLLQAFPQVSKSVSFWFLDGNTGRLSSLFGMGIFNHIGSWPRNNTQRASCSSYWPFHQHTAVISGSHAPHIGHRTESERRTETNGGGKA